jgi:hypothetical protein
MSCHPRFFFANRQCELGNRNPKKSSRMTPQELTAQGLTRRSFVKTSALTVGAVSFLSRGVALATTPSEEQTKQFKMEYAYGLITTAQPKKDGNPVSSMESVVGVHDSSNNSRVGTLTINVIATIFPADSVVVTTEEKANGIPSSKVELEKSYQQKGKIEYDGALPSFAHPNNARVPASGYETTASVEAELQFYQKFSAVWNEGDQPADPPSSPAIMVNPTEVSARSMSPSGTNIVLLAEWSDWGWVWQGIMQRDAEVEITITHVGSWSPGSEEAKTGTCVLVWGQQRARRERLHTKIGNGDWMVSNWSAWLPD